MADSYQAVGAMVAPIKSPDTFGQLSNILGIQQQRTALQNQALELQQNQIKTQAAQDNNSYFSSFDPTQYVTPNGTTDVTKIMASDPNYQKLTGAGKVQVTQNLQAIQGKQIANMSAMSTMDNDTVNAFGQTMGALATDKDVVADNPDGRSKTAAAAQAFAMRNPEAAKIAGIYSPAFKLPQDGGAKQGHLGPAVSAIAAQAQTVSQQQAQSNPETQNVDQGGTIAQQTVNRATGQPTTVNTLTKSVPPGAQVVKDANDNSYVLDPKTNTLQPIGAGHPQQKAAGSGFVQPAPDAKTVSDSIESARTAGDLTGLNRHINDQLLALSKDTSTGYGTKAWQSAIGALSGGKFGADYQTIGGYLDRQAALAQKSMGLPETNAGLATAQGATATTEYSPGALQTKVKLADTLNTAAQQFRQGLDKTVGVGPNQDNSKYQAYRSAWAQNFDPQVFAAENALRRGDKEELAKIQTQEGPQGMADLKRKTIALRQLANGQLPQQ
jgi:hypothetical protein